MRTTPCLAFPVSEMDRKTRIGAGNAGVGLFLWEKHGGKMAMICQCRDGKLKKGKVVEVAYEGWVISE